MNFIIFFLLIGSFTDCYGLLDIPKDSVKHIAYDLFKYLDQGLKNFTNSAEDQFILPIDPRDGCLGKTDHALVWKGIYTNTKRTIINQTVAVKIIWEPQAMDEEMDIFNALNATKNLEIEKYGIPRVYYYGSFLKHYHAIAMTLFDGTVADRYASEEENGRSLSDLTILSIFMQAVEGLKYLNSMHVVHNDIKPENLFLRGEKLFISDFDLSTLNGTQNEGHTTLFASANFYLEQNRTAIDDLESLVYSIWYIADVPMVRDWIEKETEGVLLGKCNKEQAKTRVLKKCSHFKNPHVYDVMKYICVDQMLSGNPVPAYDEIIAKLKKAIELVEKEPKKIFINWLRPDKSKTTRHFGLFD